MTRLLSAWVYTCTLYTYNPTCTAFHPPSPSYLMYLRNSLTPCYVVCLVRRKIILPELLCRVLYILCAILRYTTHVTVFSSHTHTHTHTHTAITCPQLEDPENGQVLLSGDTLSSTATYICDSGYTLMGVLTRTCQSDGTWSDQAPLCMGIYMYTVHL